MEIQVNSSGAISILFNDKIINCATDLDCATYNGYCVTNPSSWTANHPSNYSGMCICSLSYALTGLDCSALSNASILFAFGYVVIGVVACLSLAYFYYLFNTRIIEIKQSTTSVTFILASLALLGFTILQLAEILDFSGTSLLKGDTRVNSLDAPQNAMTILAFLFTAISTLMVSLVWLEFAMALKKTTLASGPRQSIHLYQWALLLYCLTFGVASFYYIIVNDAASAAAFGIPAYLFVIICYASGWYTLSSLLRRYIDAGREANRPRSGTETPKEPTMQTGLLKLYAMSRFV